MKNKILTTIFILLFLFSPFLSSASTNLLLQKIEILKWEISVFQTLLSNFRLRQEINSPSYIAVNISNNSILLERNSNIRYPIASITKLMSAVITLENIDKNQKIKVTDEMLKPLGHSPSIFAGLNISAENLLRASLIQSTNDASESLSYFIGKEKFIELMNEKAKEIGMTSTIFYDSHGLNPLNQSTASDLSNLKSYIYKNHPEILTITKENNFWLPDKTGTLLKFRNVNNFYPLLDFIGGKTGYIKESKQTMASIFNVNGNPVSVILLYSNNRQADIFNILRQLK